jgi:hypothetical protein
MDKVFSIEDSLRFGWQKTKEHSLVLFQVVLTLFAFNIVSSIIQSALQSAPALNFLLSLLFTVVGVVLGTGLLVITLKIAKGQAVSYRDIVPPLELVWWVFLASILVGVLVIAGLILLVIPGIYFALRFAMVKYAVVDGARVLESFQMSTKMTDGHKWQLLLLFIAVVIVNIIGLLLLVVGLLVTVPVTMIAMAQVYLKLKEKAGVTAAPVLAAHEHHDHDGHDHSA